MTLVLELKLKKENRPLKNLRSLSLSQHVLFLMNYISFLQEYIRSNGFPKPTSGQQEMYEVILNNAMQH